MRTLEKDNLLDLLAEPGRWCQDVEARDACGAPVRYDDVDAAAWDLTGAVCHLFGWKRAGELFVQLERHMLDRPARQRFEQRCAIASMAALQDHNDRHETTYEALIEQLRSAPVWDASRRDSGPG